MRLSPRLPRNERKREGRRGGETESCKSCNDNAGCQCRERAGGATLRAIRMAARTTISNYRGLKERFDDESPGWKVTRFTEGGRCCGLIIVVFCRRRDSPAWRPDHPKDVRNCNGSTGAGVMIRGII